MSFCKFTLYTLILFLLSAFHATSQIISTVAGTGAAGYYGNGIQATIARLHDPSCVAFDAAGNYYIADMENSIIRKVSPSGIITTIAGRPGFVGDTGDGGPATSAKLNLPRVIALDTANNVYIADAGNNKIRMVNAKTGVISTVAGNGNKGFLGDGGLATSAELFAPLAVALDKQGNLYIADEGNNRIREVHSNTGIITTIAGNGSQGFSGDGGPATNAQFDLPCNIALDDTGNIYVADWFNDCVRKISKKTGLINTVAGIGGASGYSGDGGPATSAELSGGIYGISFDAVDNMYIADAENECIRQVNTRGIISTVAGGNKAGYSGDGGVAIAAKLDIPNQVAFDSQGNMYIPDWDNNVIRKVTNTGGLLGVPNKKENQDFVSVFPNPAKDRLSVELTPAYYQGKEMVSFYTIQGELLLSQSYSNQDNISLNLSTYTDGIYILEIKAEDGTTVIKKVEIQK